MKYIITATLFFVIGLVIPPFNGEGAPAPSLTKTYRVTAYCPCSKCCGKYADGITASGHIIESGDRFIAAPRDIPFGTEFDVPGYGVVKCLDRGGAITDDRLDLYFDTHQEALNWGVQYLEVSRNL